MASSNSLVENVNNFEDVANAPKHHQNKPVVQEEKPQEKGDPENKDQIKMNVVRTNLDLLSGTQRDSHSLVDNVDQFEDVANQPKHIAKTEADENENENKVQV